MNKFKRIVMMEAVNVALVFVATSASAKGLDEHTPQEVYEHLARQMSSEDPLEAERAIHMLRYAGPQALDVMFEVLAADLTRAESEPTFQTSPQWQRVSAALDAICQQHDCYASRLYWYTDLERAKVAARSTGKPILSLRLLGNLSDEFSCANSRFFRTTLYADPAVSRYLRDHFVLHWKSVRPVPRVTIDFGNGRKLERTLTGNSVHYVLDAEGRSIDALPGLYGPKAFLRGLARAEGLAKGLAGLGGQTWKGYLNQYHRGRLAAIQREWGEDLSRIEAPAVAQPAALKSAPRPSLGKGSSPRPAESILTNLQRGWDAFARSANNVAKRTFTASEASEVAMTKTVVSGEGPMLRSLAIPPTVPEFKPFETKTDEKTWREIASLHAEDARLDDTSKALIRRQNPPGGSSESLIQTLERSIALDTVRNEYLLHRRIHEWFINESVGSDVESLNERVYAELFRTPSSDPWLGLVTPDTYTALQDNGIRMATTDEGRSRGEDPNE